MRQNVTPIERPPLKHDSYELKSIYSTLSISPETFRAWERRGAAPLRDIKGGRWDRVSALELQRWLDRLDLDRKATGKPWLKRPVSSYSWLTPEERAALAGAAAAAIKRIRAKRAGERA